MTVEQFKTVVKITDLKAEEKKKDFRFEENKVILEEEENCRE